MKIKDLANSFDDKIRFRFPYEKIFLWVGVKRNGDFKFHIDLGQHKLKGKELNVFANLKSTTKF